ncbi:hypothetical protein [Streptomyces sp. NPDC088733]|uniref:hypothetical protein n=1 Tax=Streptomyces sp. NPDC088733 TaxID=3365880 RepID=UPI0037F352B9
MNANPGPDRRPGQWPVPRTQLHAVGEDEQQMLTRAQANAERARWELTLGAIRGHLEEQPSPRAVHATGRLWATAIAQLTEEIATAMRTQTKERGQ